MSSQNGRHRNNNKNTGSPEWYTPAWMLDKVRAFYGADFFDPCPASLGVVRENGLLLPWKGRRVWVNPPYGKPIEQWIIKAMTEPVREIIMLTPASTEAQWFAPFYDHTICFIFRRMTFEKLGIAQSQSPHGSVLVYRGRRHRQFAEAFCDLGPVMRTYMPMRAKQPTLFLPGEMALEEAV